MAETAEHGTLSSYTHGCHCSECRKVWAAYQRDYNARQRANAARFNVKPPQNALSAAAWLEDRAGEYSGDVGRGFMLAIRLLRGEPAATPVLSSPPACQDKEA